MEPTKACTKCGETKSLSKFSKHRLSKDGHAYQCKDCNNKRAKIWRGTPTGIYTNIKGRENHRKRKPFEITKEQFLEWYGEEPKFCHYCEISEENAPLMRKYFGAHGIQLSIDCKDNLLGYVLGNMVLACDRCNFIKSNIFTYDEMLVIGKRFMKPKWMTFPEITKGRGGGDDRDGY